MRTKRIRRKLGFYKDRDGLYTRYILENGNWDTHLANCRKNILKAAEAKNKKLCVVLGSGWWLDIPVDELSKMFERLVLVDITHPAQIVHAKQKYANVELVETDITNISSDFFEALRPKNRNENSLFSLIKNENNFGLGNLLSEADFVVSANLLTQLGVFFFEYLKKKKYFSEKAMYDFVKMIQNNHLQNLPVQKTCLIVDYYQRAYDKSDKAVSEKSRILVDLSKLRVVSQWVWNFDLKGNFKKGEKVFFDVNCFDV